MYNSHQRTPLDRIHLIKVLSGGTKHIQDGDDVFVGVEVPQEFQFTQRAFRQDAFIENLLDLFDEFKYGL